MPNQVVSPRATTSRVAKPSQPQVQAPESKGKLSALLCLVVVATVLAYLPVLFNWFAGDDFVHLTWLRYAVNQPELIWKNFYSSWLDGTTTKFYRPLISIFMVTDYLVWKTNALGFHLTNLTFHITSSLLLFGIVRQVQQQLTGVRNNAVAVLSAAIFALYPLHPEAVSWITGRVDSVVTTFCLGSIWSYLKWRDSERRLWLVASLSTLILGLLSKEMAITVPAVICSFELLAQRPTFSRFLKTAPYWLVLVGYFIVRRLALGTFVGGYDDSLLFIANLKEFLFGWLHALRMLVIPINKEMLGSHNLLTKAWELCAAAAVVIAAVRFVRVPESRRPMLFALAWIVLSLLPVYKLFAIANDLQGSRLAYLATVPLSILAAYGLAIGKRHIFPAAFCVLSATLLLVNNQPWREAGQQANALRASLQSIYEIERGDPQTLLIGMPDQHKGAYISRNAIWGMTKYPQLKGDIWNCLTLNEFEPVHPFGFLKPSLVASRADVRVYRWDEYEQKFATVRIDSRTADGAALSVASVPVSNDTAISAPKKGARPELVFSPEATNNVTCWDTDFVKVELDLVDAGTFPTGADLLYANDINPEFELGRRTHADITAGQKHQSLLFALRSLPEWSFGNSDSRLKLLLPPDAKAFVRSIEVVPASKVTPQVNFTNSGYMGTKGYLHLGKDKMTQQLAIDSSAVADAAGSEIEITRANLLFEEQNAHKYSSLARDHQAAPLTGSITLKKTDFPAPGIYELRVWAKDASGKLLGLSSDHIVLAVDP